jgi:general secretion pathway protein D
MMLKEFSVQARKAVILGTLIAMVPLLLTGCELEGYLPNDRNFSDIQDRQQRLSKQDYKDLNDADKLLPDDAKVTADLGAPPVPDLAQVLAAPRPPKVGNAKLVTLAVTEDVPLRDVLFELGRLANVDIEVGPGLDSTGINLRATDRPFNEVIERISTLGNLRYSVDGSSIRVERDTPYIKNYNLDFVNLVRSSNSSYNLSTSILTTGSSKGGSSGGSSSSSGSGSGSGSGMTTGGVGTAGSSASITAQSDSDLWSSLEASITEILNYSPAGAGAASAQQASGGSGTTAGGAAAAGGTSNFVINRQAGVLSVNATERQHEVIQRFLTTMQRSASAQVLIEAKIVEVSLRDQFLSGVNWQDVLGGNQTFFSPTYPANSGFNPIGDVNSSMSFAANGASAFGLKVGDLDLLVQFTERFGTTRTLSSPRLSAMNNQQAVLTFAQNTVFFDCTIETPSTTTTDTSTSETAGSADCTANSVPIGIILNILPSINLDTQEVTLSVRPTLTRQVGQQENPEGRLISAIVAQSGGDTDDIPRTFVPVVEVREIDSVMKVKSGGVMVIGGLMEDNSTTETRGMPGMSDVPVVGNLFKSRDEDYRKRELVIFIKATIVNSDGSTDPVDRSVYKKYFTDPRKMFK